MKNKIKTGERAAFILLAAVAFVFILSIQNVFAQERYGCCYKKTDGKYCEETYDTLCEQGQFLGSNCTDSKNSAKCGLVTCATTNGCMLNVKKGKCLYENKGTVAMGDECTKGCCGIAGRSYGIIDKKVCRTKAFDKGFNESYMEFFADIQDEHQCAAHFEPTVKGCCIAEGCKDTTRAECQGEFHADVLCKQIPTRCQVQEVGLRCGKMPGNENKVVVLDSSGGEEAKYSCSLPQYRCIECGNENCTLSKEEQKANPGRGKSIDQFDGYCVDTRCYFGDIGQQQAVDKNGKISAVPASTTVLNTGQSVCYNFYGVASDKKGIDKEKKDTFDNETKQFTDVTHMLRSTGLQNHVLVCNYGDLQVVGLGDDRKLLCADDPNIYVAKKFDNINSTDACVSCGSFDPKIIINPLGDYVSAGWMFGGVFGRLISDQCTPGECKSIKSPEGEQLCYYSYDTFLRGETLPKNFGSQPPGSCVPRFPLGSTESCGACGGGGDFMWNICKEDECYALGNCQFKYNNPVRGGFYFIASVAGFYGANRLGGFPIEALAITADTCKFQFTCYPATYVKVLPDVIADAITSQVVPAFKTMFGLMSTIGTVIGEVIGNIDRLKGVGESIKNLAGGAAKIAG
jgi:hypothetical protein